MTENNLFLWDETMFGKLRVRELTKFCFRHCMLSKEVKFIFNFLWTKHTCSIFWFQTWPMIVKHFLEVKLVAAGKFPLAAQTLSSHLAKLTKIDFLPIFNSLSNKSIACEQALGKMEIINIKESKNKLKTRLT